MRLLIIICVLFTGCAAKQVKPVIKPIVKPVVVLTPPTIPTDHVDISNMPAGKLLEMGMASYGKRNFDVALIAFQAAVSSGDLNYAGKTLCYYYISDSYFNLGNLEEAENTLFNFAVSAEIILEGDIKYAVAPDGSDFVQRFGLKSKLEQANDYFEYAWNKRKQPK